MHFFNLFLVQNFLLLLIILYFLNPQEIIININFILKYFEVRFIDNSIYFQVIIFHLIFQFCFVFFCF